MIGVETEADASVSRKRPEPHRADILVAPSDRQRREGGADGNVEIAPQENENDLLIFGAKQMHFLTAFTMMIFFGLYTENPGIFPSVVVNSSLAFFNTQYPEGNNEWKFIRTSNFELQTRN